MIKLFQEACIFPENTTHVVDFSILIICISYRYLFYILYINNSEFLKNTKLFGVYENGLCFATWSVLTTRCYVVMPLLRWHRGWSAAVGAAVVSYATKTRSDTRYLSIYYLIIL